MRSFFLMLMITFANSQIASSQIDLDSLTRTLHNLKRKADESGSNMTMFLDDNNLILFKINYSQFKIENDTWNVAIIEYKYDSLGRQTLFKSYDANGYLSNAEMPPILITTFNDEEKIIRHDYFSKNNVLTSRTETKMDNKNREIQLETFNSAFVRTSKKITEYDDVNLSAVSKYLDNKNSLQKNECGVAFFHKKYSTNEFVTVKEEIFYDENMMLIDCTHNGQDYLFSKINYIYLTKHKVKCTFYNDKNEKVNSVNITN